MRHANRSLSFLWILSALAVGACAVAPEAPDGGLPPLTLSAANDLPEVTIHPTQVTVKNGRGETLLDGAPDRDYRLSGNPRAGQFDGTLNITTVYDNGTTKTQTLTHDPARRVKLEWDPRQKQYVVSGIDAPTPADARPAPGEPGWAIQAFGDFKRTPYDATTVRSSGSNTVGSPDLSDRMGSLGVGLRRYFATTGAGIQPFAYAGFSEYFGNGVRGADVTYHFGATPDTGGEIKEERSFLAGVGGYMQLTPKLGVDLMAGLHATRIRVSAFSDERSGGGPNNVFSSSKWLFGPTVGGRLSMPLFVLGQGSPVIGFLQYHAMLMRDVSEGGVSPFTSNTYSLRADGGVQHKVMFGLEKRF